MYDEKVFKRGYYVSCVTDILTVASTKPAVFSHLTPFDLVDRHQNFGETRHFHFYTAHRAHSSENIGN